MKLREEFTVHDTLNPKIFEVTTKKLLPEVRLKIIEIVKEFEDTISIPMDICDIQLVGSNASYNYNDTSDLDVHIIVNFDSITSETGLLQSLYNAKKADFNNNYDIKIHGIDIEMYVQDVKSGISSNGIYSICDDRWVKEPKPIKSIKKHNTEKELEKWTEKINEVLSSKNYDSINQTINCLYLLRHNSIAIDGEYGKGNQLFKDIRSAGLLDKLKNASKTAKSKRLSLEELSDGQIVSRFEEDK